MRTWEMFVYMTTYTRLPISVSMLCSELCTNIICTIFLMNIYVDPPEYTVASQFDVNSGESLSVSLTLDAFPLPGANDFSWTFNGQPLMSSARISFSVDSIQFTNIQFSDGGIYMITATNEAGSGSASFTLVVNGGCLPSASNTHMHARKHAHTHSISVHACMHAHTHAHTCMHARTHVCTHTHAHTHMHTGHSQAHTRTHPRTYAPTHVHKVT